MVFYETWTSRRLEGYARARGLSYGIAFTPGNAGGRYHVISKGGEPCVRWHSLGWNRKEAEETVEIDSSDNPDPIAPSEHDQSSYWLNNGR